MPECPNVFSGSRGSNAKPRLFFTLCFLLSVVIVVITGYFLYYPDGLVVSNGGHNFDFEQHARRPGLRSELQGRSTSGVGVNGDNGRMDLNDDQIGIGDGIDSNEVDYTQSKISSVDTSDHSEGQSEADLSPRLRHRHHAHHHEKHVPISVEELEQGPILSNVIESRLIHFDLKGAPPKVSYLKEVLKLAKKAGINGLLLEWEDTFPWSRSLRNISLLEGGYSREEAEDLINYAELVLDMEVIPLVQTFGHVEFVLKGSEFRHLREVDQDPQAFCPSKSETMTVIKEMIDQVLELHKRSRFVHIGCDEVFNLRVCPICTAATEFKEELFLKHVIDVAKYVRKQGRIPIIWDDMLRIVSLRRLNESGIGTLVEPMVWVYAEDVDRFVGWEAWEKYAEIFPVIWGAAAFKGAFGETLSIPPLSRHADNVDHWINVITRESPKWTLGTGGLVLTGWTRYDHFSVLAELLPAAIPSLIYNSLQLSIPSSAVAPIKNRVFISPNQDPTEVKSSTSTTMSPTSMIYSSEETPPHDDLSKIPPENKEPEKHSHLSKRSPNYRRQIAHPRILMAKDHLTSRLSPPGHGSRELSTQEIYDKFDHVAREFCQILNCPNYHTRLDALLKGSDSELSFASRCNFSGVAFYRSLFRLKSNLIEAWELIAKIERKRGWVTPYNIRHNYSLPLRVDEVLGEVPRLRKQLEIVVKGIEASLKPIFRQEIILEWIEQNVWEAWKALKKLEDVGDALKNINVWPRRPLQSPWDMVEGLRLSRVEPDEL